MRKQQRPRVLLQRPNFLHEDLRISVLRTRSHCQTPFFSSLLDEYFNNQRTNYPELSPETEESVRQFNSNTVEGNRQIWEVIP